MPDNEELPVSDFRFKQIGSIILALTLFLGGILLLSLNLPGWSLILGLPAVQIGIIFLIFSFDEIAREKVGPVGLRSIPCSICGDQVVVRKGVQEAICEDCQQKISQKLKTKKRD